MTSIKLEEYEVDKKNINNAIRYTFASLIFVFMVSLLLMIMMYSYISINLTQLSGYQVQDIGLEKIELDSIGELKEQISGLYEQQNNIICEEIVGVRMFSQDYRETCCVPTDKDITLDDRYDMVLYTQDEPLMCVYQKSSLRNNKTLIIHDDKTINVTNCLEMEKYRDYDICKEVYNAKYIYPR